MVRREQMQKHVLKKVEQFRSRQRKALTDLNDQTKKRQYRELEEILSPFWAWRALAR